MNQARRNTTPLLKAGLLAGLLLLFSVASALAAAPGAAPVKRATGAHSLNVGPRQPRKLRRAHASIIGGSSVPISSYPSLAYIDAETGPREGFNCTGTVVAPRVILTAGHCVEPPESGELTPPSDYAVATGLADLTQVSRANVSLVTQAVVFPGFQPGTLHGDAGLLILAEASAAPAIRLASSGDGALLAPGTPVSVAGWGLTNPQAAEGPAELQAATTVIQSATYCQRQVGRYYPFYSSSSQLCAIDPPSYSVSTCHGDSGGPAIAVDGSGTPVEVGITSFATQNCMMTLPDGFTRVDRVSSWVASWVSAVELGGPTPAVHHPRVRLPRMTIQEAHRFVDLGLSEHFRYRYRRGTYKRIGCERVEATKVKCGLTWYQGGNDYYGTITVYFLQYQGVIYWNDRYKIHWVDDHCWFFSGHRQTCVIRTAHQ
jgi:V8-like Glu-specific endopeptidase